MMIHIMILCGIKSRKQKKTGLKGFEPLTDGLRVRRYS